MIFLHIFKAGGTSLRKIIRRQHPLVPVRHFSGHFDNINAWRNLPQAERDIFRLLMGHQHYGNHEYLSEPATYMIVLRDPVDRVISYYYFIKRHKEHQAYQFGFTDETTLAEFVGNSTFIELDNIQTRLLNPQPERQYPFGSIDEGMLRVAKSNLEAIHRVGVVERMDNFLELLRRAEGWTIDEVFHASRTAGRPEVEAHDEAVLERIRELNRYDILLYEAARERFERDWAECLSATSPGKA